jgi:hypothetical protein
MMAYAETEYALIKADIERDGRHILGIPDGEPAPFAYTIGNELKGLPELLLIGVSRKAGLLNVLSDMMIERGTRFADGELVDLGGKHPVKIINANAMAQSRIHDPSKRLPWLRHLLGAAGLSPKLPDAGAE